MHASPYSLQFLADKYWTRFEQIAEDALQVGLAKIAERFGLEDWNGPVHPDRTNSPQCSNTVHEIFRMPNTRTHRLIRLSRSQNTQREGRNTTRIELNHDNMNENKGCLSPNYEPSNKHTIACTLTSTLQRRSSPSVLGSTRHHNGAHWEAGLGPRYSSTTVTGLQDGYAPRGDGDLDLVHGADMEHTH